MLVGGAVAVVAADARPTDSSWPRISASVHAPGSAAALGPATATPAAASVAPPTVPGQSRPPSKEIRNASLRLARSAPVRLRMPAIGVDSPLMQLGLQKDGSLEVPPAGFPAGWFTGAPTPGELGPAIIAGHVDWNGRPGVFYDLRGTQAGDVVDVVRSDGTIAAFRVTRVAQVTKNAFPSALVYGNVDHAALRLITCGGSFDPGTRSYTDNIVVFADLVGSRAA